MAIEDVARRVTYTGNGSQTDFPFSFVVFNAETDILVYQKVDNASEVTVPSSAFSVTLNADQASNPGGKVTMSVAPGNGVVIAILSNVAYEQTMELTTHDGFDPRTLNKNADRIVAQIQQLKEGLSRAIVTDPTDSMTPQELKNKLLDAANDATVIAKGYAEAAAASAMDAKGSADAAAKSSENAAAVESRVNAKEANLSAGLTQVSNDEQAKIIAEGNRQVTRVESVGAGQIDKVNVAGQQQVDRVAVEGDKQINRVGVRGDSEVARLNRVGEIVLDRSGLRCKAGTHTFDATIAAGVEVTLPAGISYVVAAKHLRLVWNGLVLYPGEQYTEVGTEFTESTTVKLTFDLKAGDVLQAWVVPLGGTKDSETGVITPDESKKCAVETWTISGASVAPAVLRLPNNMTYVAGKDHLRMSWNGLVLMQPYEYEEVGEVGAPSNQIKLNLGLSAGDVLNAWTVPYAAGEPSETQQQIAVLQDALAELSRKVVYKDAQ